MRIANYLRPDCVALRQRADSLTGAVQQMVTLLDGTDNLTDTAVFAADVRARLALGGVCVGNGLAIPHAKSTAVRQLQLAALTLDPPKPTTCTYRRWPSWRRSFWTPISAPACGRVRPPRHSAAPSPRGRIRTRRSRRLPRLTQRRVPPSPAISCWP